jgi:hypothetical protein
MKTLQTLEAILLNNILDATINCLTVLLFYSLCFMVYIYCLKKNKKV